jgi:hypothetical protein
MDNFDLILVCYVRVYVVNYVGCKRLDIIEGNIAVAKNMFRLNC